MFNFYRVLAAAVALIVPLSGPGLPEVPLRQITLATLQDSYEMYASEKILEAAYLKLGYRLRIQKYTGDIALKKSEAGEVDGEVHRIDGLERDHKNLIQISVPINYFDLGIYSLQSGLHPKSISDLENFRVGIVRGVVASERSSSNHSKIFRVDNYLALFELLPKKEVDAVYAITINAERILRKMNARGIYRNVILESHLCYHYLHRKNAFLVPKITEVLREMLRRGEVQQIRQRANAEMIAGKSVIQ